MRDEHDVLMMENSRLRLYQSEGASEVPLGTGGGARC